MIAVTWLASAWLRAEPVTFVFTSDVHYGITRGTFRGEGNVESRMVDAALVEKINRLPTALLPSDSTACKNAPNCSSPQETTSTKG